MGFDFRMSMGVADFWIKTLKAKKDEEWHVGDMFYQLTNKRHDERTISYAECHDQAMVGDKTIIFWLIDKEMYTGMNVFEPNMVVDRGVALHKLIRMASLSTAGDGYLNFMGNEFGHPEWIDFPREGNGWSYKYARRQWSLADNEKLKYKFLAKFDADMLALAKKYKLLTAQDTRQLWVDQENKILVFRKAGLIFVFNFHAHNSPAGYVIPAEHGKYKVVFDSDAHTYGGQERIDRQTVYQTAQLDKYGFPIYLPCRTALVLKRI